MAKDKVFYSEFGAKGDGVTDDFDAIVAAHEYANENSLPVFGDKGAKYYIGPTRKTAIIKTPVDWTDSEFIIDDREIPLGEYSGTTLFYVPSLYEFEELKGITSLKKGQKHIDNPYGCELFVRVIDENVRQFKRKANGGGDGVEKCDTFIVDKDGNILSDIIWDFDNITSIRAKRIEEPMTIKGGHFITLANKTPTVCGYYGRGIGVNRSRLTITGLVHDVEGEVDEYGCPYMGFIILCDTAYNELNDVKLTAHQNHWMGSYDMQVNYSAFVKLNKLVQLNDINDEHKWGLMCTNFCKDFYINDSVVSRFDAHMGVTNCYINNSTFGWMTIHLIGHGTFKLENSEVYGRWMVELRDDYGAHFDGDMYITDCVWHVTHFVPAMLYLHNCGAHDFGYECTMPHNIYVTNLTIDDTMEIEDYRGLRLFMDVDNHRDVEKLHPYKMSDNIVFRNLKVLSGKKAYAYGVPFIYENVNFDLDEVSEENIEWLDPHERY